MKDPVGGHKFLYDDWAQYHVIYFLQRCQDFCAAWITKLL